MVTESFGIISLLPVVVVLVYVLYTKKIFEGLIFGSLLEFIIVYRMDFFGKWLEALLDVMGDSNTVWIILTCGLFCSLTKLLELSKGSFGFARMVQKFAKTEKNSLFLTWLLGIAIFVDDYLNVFTIGSAMRPVIDKNKTPREMLAYVADSTAAPTCVLIPFSTWVAYFSVLFAKQEEFKHLGTAMQLYTRSIPYMFYAWVALLIVPFVIFGIIPIMGPMKKAYHRVRETGCIHSERSSFYSNDELAATTDSDINLEEGKLINFILPITVLIAMTVYTDDLLLGTITGISVAAFMYITTKVMNFSKFTETLIGGFSEMMPIIFTIIAAWTFQRGSTDLGLTNYIIEAIRPFTSPALLPAIAFIVLCILTFVTGSNWGVTTICIPIIVPLCVAVGSNPYLTIGAIISGAVFGSHACFYTDTTILASMACKVDNMDHALTQIPYVLISAGISLVLYIVLGIVM